MPIDRDLGQLPRPVTAREQGWEPDRDPRFVHLLAEKWMAEAVAEGPRARAVPDKRFRHSDAGKCARALSYAALDLPKSNPMDVTGFWVTRLGSTIHDMLQEVLEERYGMMAEVVCVIDGFEGSGHADGEVTRRGMPSDEGPPCRVVAEFKSVGGFAYKLAVGERGTAKGPSWSYVVQGALNAKARHADELVIGLLARDVISIPAAKRSKIDLLTRFCAEWTLTREEYEPIADQEIARVTRILELLDEGTLPGRNIPDPELPKHHVITDPSRGIWVEADRDGNMIDSGSTWHCGYCDWLDTCATTGPGRAPVTEVTIGRKGDT